MSRNIPVYMRHKHRAAPEQEVSRNASLVVLKLAAILCGIVGFIALVIAVRGLIDGPHTGPGLLAPAAYCVGAIASVVVGLRVSALKRWACFAAVAGFWIVCLAYPWRPELYRGAVIDLGEALVASVMACVVVAVPVTIACVVYRSKLKPGF